MIRVWRAAVVVTVLAITTGAASVMSAQDVPGLAGRWVLNRELSQFPRELGFNADWIAAPSSGDESSSGGAGGAGPRQSASGTAATPAKPNKPIKLAATGVRRGTRCLPAVYL